MSKADRINEAIREHCAALGYTFKPWQPVPWEVDGPEPPAWAGRIHPGHPAGSRRRFD